VSDPLNKTPCLVNQVYSIITHTKLSDYLYQMATGENRVGSKQSREKCREREKQINGVRDGALDGNRNGVG
jgi:hypothetical protein